MSDDVKRRIVMRRICDKPMAKKKGLLKHCRHRCLGCIAAIEIEDNGEMQHTGYAQGEGVETIRLRNAEVLLKQGRVISFTDPFKGAGRPKGTSNTRE